MRMDLFKQGLKGKVKQIIAGHTYANFQEMYQKVVKVARIISETKIENREKRETKKKFDLGGSNYQGNRNFRWFKPGMK